MPDSKNVSPAFDPRHLNADLFGNALRQMAEASRFGMVILDEEWRVVWCNTEFGEKFGYRREEVLGTEMLTRLLGPDVDPERVTALKRREISMSGETDQFLGYAKDGHTRWVEVYSQPITDDDGARTGYTLAIDRDITQVKLGEALGLARRTALERLGEGADTEAILTALVKGMEGLFPEMRISIVMLDAEGRRFRNVVGPNLPRLFIEPLRGLKIGPEVGTCGSAAYHGERVITRDINTDPKWASYRDLAELSGMRSCWSEPVKDVGGRVLGTFAIYYPVSRIPSDEELDFIGQAAELASIVIERKQLEDELQLARRRAEDASIAKSRFLANMSHELRTPLNAVIGFSELISAGAFDKDIEKYNEFASEIAGSARTLLALISTLLDSANLQQGTYQLEERIVDLKVVIGLCRAGAAEEARRQGVDIRVDWPDRMPVLFADPSAVETVLARILDNALKFSPENSDIHVSGQVDEAGNVIISVSDSGQGIPSEDVDRVLEPFEQGGDASAYLARKYGGTGLGLAICHSLMQLHGGDVTLRSVAGEGTRARILFPASRVILSRAADDSAATPADAEAAAGSDRLR